MNIYQVGKDSKYFIRHYLLIAIIFLLNVKILFLCKPNVSWKSLHLKFLFKTEEYKIQNIILVRVISIFSYEEVNLRMSERHKRYRNDIPRFLHNKPKAFIKHCLNRMPPVTPKVPEMDIHRDVSTTSSTLM